MHLSVHAHITHAQWVGCFHLCSWSISWCCIISFYNWCAFSMVFSEGMVSWNEMSCAQGSAIGVVAACLLRLWLMPLSLVPLPQHVWCEFLQLSLWRRQGLCPMIFPLHLSEDRAGRHVAFPKGMVSCLPGRELGTSRCHFRLILDACGWLLSVSPLLLQPTAIVSLCWLGGCLSFRICIRSLVCAFSLFCVALVAYACFSPGHCCAA